MTPRSAERVLALALLGWGLGHVALGDRRGWLLLLAEAGSLIVLVGAGLPRLGGDAAGAVYLALVLFFVAWAAQGVDAHRRAGEAGAPLTGALLVMALLPVAVAVFTCFWLNSGASATPTGTLERFVSAWRDDLPDEGDRLLLEPAGPTSLAATWRRADAIIHDRIVVLAATLGPGSGLHLDDPFTDLEFRLVEEADGQPGETAVVEVLVVRQSVGRSTFLGLFPTAVQVTEVLGRLGTIRLQAVRIDLSGTLSAWPPTREWRVEGLDIGPPEG